MSKILYEPQRFVAAAEQVLGRCETILDEQAQQGYRLTLRQLYYRLIAADAFPDSRLIEVAPGQFTKNHLRNYKWLGDILSKARIGGRIDWRHIEDRTRGLEGGDSGLGSPDNAVRIFSDGYNITRWDGQPEHVEVWVEKDALSDVISRPARRWDVPYLACKGSPSTSVIHDAAQRLRRYERDGVKCTVLYLGDHDPTGIDIPRDIQERLALFRCDTEVERIALNMDQIEELDPPPSPAKETDSRTTGYIERFGTEDTWELDALEPAALDTLIDGKITEHIDFDLRQERLDREERERRLMISVADNWDTALEHLREQGLLDE